MVTEWWSLKLSHGKCWVQVNVAEPPTSRFITFSGSIVLESSQSIIHLVKVANQHTIKAKLSAVSITNLQYCCHGVFCMSNIIISCQTRICIINASLYGDTLFRTLSQGCPAAILGYSMPGLSRLAHVLLITMKVAQWGQWSNTLVWLNDWLKIYI